MTKLNKNPENLNTNEDGIIELPGTLKTKGKVEKTKKIPKEKITKPKTEKVPKEPKPYKGLDSKYISTNNTINTMVDGMQLISKLITTYEILPKYKISTYKNEMRIAFDTHTASEIMNLCTDTERILLKNMKWNYTDKNPYFSFELCSNC